MDSQERSRGETWFKKLSLWEKRRKTWKRRSILFMIAVLLVFYIPLIAGYYLPSGVSLPLFLALIPVIILFAISFTLPLWRLRDFVKNAPENIVVWMVLRLGICNFYRWFAKLYLALFVLLAITVAYQVSQLLAGHIRVESEIGLSDIVIIVFTGALTIIEFSRFRREYSWPNLVLDSAEAYLQPQLQGMPRLRLECNIYVINDSEKGYILGATAVLPFDYSVLGKTSEGKFSFVKPAETRKIEFVFLFDEVGTKIVTSKLGNIAALIIKLEVKRGRAKHEVFIPLQLTYMGHEGGAVKWAVRVI